MRKTQSLKSNLYTYGKFGKALRETIDTDSGTLYDRGRIKTALTEDDITDSFVRIHCRDIWYMTGFIRTDTMRHIVYEPTHNNHLFKDDYIYISYGKNIKRQTDNNGFTYFSNADFRISGHDIVNVINHAEQHGIPDILPEIQKAKSEIRKKVEWFRQNHPDDYFRTFNTNETVDPFKNQTI